MKRIFFIVALALCVSLYFQMRNKPPGRTPVFSNHPSVFKAYDNKMGLVYVKLAGKYCAIPKELYDGPVGDGRGKPVEYEGKYAVINGAPITGLMPDLSGADLPTEFVGETKDNFVEFNKIGKDNKTLRLVVKGNNLYGPYYDRPMDTVRQEFLEKQTEWFLRGRTRPRRYHFIYELISSDAKTDVYKFEEGTNEQYLTGSVYADKHFGRVTECYELHYKAGSFLRSIFAEPYYCEMHSLHDRMNISATFSFSYVEKRDLVERFIKSKLMEWCRVTPEGDER
ncbi:MAG: hypothetical protein LBR29_02520 [Methylobacteriaceae bacterium]|jgi:hypothetical protein|nr:hypothetical protein [Methylobacteriaceae bacterium]